MKTMNVNRYMQLAIQIAEDTTPFANAQIGAILVCKGQVIAFGNNYNPKTHPLAKRYGKNKKALFLHAEVATLRNAQKRGFRDWNQATLFVARVQKSGKVAISKPCSGCRRAIDDFNIKQVFYTNNKGEICT